MDWSGSEYLKQAEIAWPVPHRFSLFGLETFGYGGQVVLPIRAEVERYGEPLAFRAAVDYLICEERSEERRGGKECGSTCRSRWPPDTSKPNKTRWRARRRPTSSNQMHLTEH